MLGGALLIKEGRTLGFRAQSLEFRVRKSFRKAGGIRLAILDR